jgi:hypothetical protein
MDEVEVVIAYITRTATSDIGSIFSWRKEEELNGHHYSLLWGTVNVGSFYVMDNYLYLHTGTEYINKCPRIIPV